MTWRRRLLAAAVVLFGGPLLSVACSQARLGQDYRSANRDSAGIAPLPADEPRAVIQAYAARAFNWRGIFAVHTWLATKAPGADHYLIHQVMGWRVRHGGAAVVSRPELPDRRWFGAEPELLLDLRGAAAAALLPKVEAAIADYPYNDSYTLWPGPNSNSFVAHVARQVPELQLQLPVTAIGKDYLDQGRLIGPAPSGTGYQASLFGLTGVMLSLREGVEVNLLGLAFGLDLFRPALKVPGIGRIGVPAYLHRGE